MTVEAISEQKGFFGLRSKERGRVLEYRNYSIRRSDVITEIYSSDLVLINAGELSRRSLEEEDWLNIELSFLKPVSEDTVELYTWNPGKNEHTFVRKLTGNKINDNNLTTDDGKLKIKWRETLPGDYLPIPEEAHISPIQLDLGLI